MTREEKQGQKIGLLKTEITGDRFDKCASRSVLDRSDILRVNELKCIWSSSLFPTHYRRKKSVETPAKEGVLTVLSTVVHGRGEEFHIEEVVTAQCAFHLFHHTPAIFQYNQQQF